MPLEKDDEDRIARKKAAGVIGRPTHEVTGDRIATALERIATALEANVTLAEQDVNLRAQAAQTFQRCIAVGVSLLKASGPMTPFGQGIVDTLGADVASWGVPGFELPREFTGDEEPCDDDVA